MGTYGILTLFNFIATNTNGGVSMILGVYWGVGGYPSSQMKSIAEIFGVLLQSTFFWIVTQLIIILMV